MNRNTIIVIAAAILILVAGYWYTHRTETQTSGVNTGGNTITSGTNTGGIGSGGSSVTIPSTGTAVPGPAVTPGVTGAGPTIYPTTQTGPTNLPSTPTNIPDK